MSGMRTGDVVVGDGTWNLTIFVTDLQVKNFFPASLTLWGRIHNTSFFFTTHEWNQ
jgi:hypothetical protein